jgi:glycosyltransferase involved in cell wall biosynthesis
MLDLDCFDIIWAERPHIARLFRNRCSRTIIDLDDIEHRRMSRARKYERSRGLGQLVKYLYRYLLYRRMELSWSRSFLATVVCSEEDRVYLEERGCRNVAVVPNSVSEQVSIGGGFATDATPDGPLRLVFVGNVAHHPNLDAITFFAEEILPRLQAVDSRTAFDVLGPSADTALQDRFASRVTFRGYVPNLATALRGYDVFVAPIRFGSGTRVKLLDAMACGIPIVTTRAGAEGLPVVDGKHMLLAEHGAEFATQILRIKRAPALGKTLALNGAALVEGHFRSSTIQSHVVQWLREIAPAGSTCR